MGRPRKFKGDTKIISFRIPKEREAELKKAFENLIEFGVAVTHVTEDSIQSLYPFKGEGQKVVDRVEVEKEIKEYEEELKHLGTSHLGQMRRVYIENQIYKLKRKLINH